MIELMLTTRSSTGNDCDFASLQTERRRCLTQQSRGAAVLHEPRKDAAATRYFPALLTFVLCSPPPFTQFHLLSSYSANLTACPSFMPHLLHFVYQKNGCVIFLYWCVFV